MLLSGLGGSIKSASVAAALGHHPVTEVKILTEPHALAHSRARAHAAATHQARLINTESKNLKTSAMIARSATIIATSPSSGLIQYSSTVRCPTNGTAALRFRIYSKPIGGTLLFNEVQAVRVANHSFSVLLGLTTNGGIPRVGLPEQQLDLHRVFEGGTPRGHPRPTYGRAAGDDDVQRGRQ